MLSVTQAARILKVNTSRVRALIRADRIKAEKVGGVWVMQRKALEAVKARTAGRPKRND
jgi:excisionase family DNA binding protein